MPEVPGSRRNSDNFMERMLQRRPSHSAPGEQAQDQIRRRSSDASEVEKPQDPTLERAPTNEGSNIQDQGLGQQALRRERRNSRLQRFKEYMRSEEEFDEVGDMYAKLM